MKRYLNFVYTLIELTVILIIRFWDIKVGTGILGWYIINFIKLRSFMTNLISPKSSCPTHKVDANNISKFQFRINLLKNMFSKISVVVRPWTFIKNVNILTKPTINIFPKYTQTTSICPHCKATLVCPHCKKVEDRPECPSSDQK